MQLTAFVKRIYQMISDKLTAYIFEFYLAGDHQWLKEIVGTKPDEEALLKSPRIPTANGR